MSVQISVQEKTKSVVVQYGPQKLFGDYDKRKSMNPAERAAIFDTAWKAGLDKAVDAAESCDAEWALERLKPAYKPFFDAALTHREFRYQTMQFVAQLRTAGSAHELSQLWFIPSSDNDPKVLYVRFETQEERNAFGRLATELGWEDDELGLRLVSQFLANCRKTPATTVAPAVIAKDGAPSTPKRK